MSAPTYRAGFINTLNGLYLNVSDPTPETIDLGDVVRGLAATRRFSGQTRQFYSVAQHSIVVALLSPRRQKKHALLHDAAEAFLGDMSKPIKVLPELAGYREVEDRLQRAICRKFGVPERKTAAIEWADDAATRHEAFEWKLTRPSWARPLMAEARLLVPERLLNTALTPHEAEDEFFRYFSLYEHET